jgi:hypothetical protein
MASLTVSRDTEFKIQKKVLTKRKASYKYGRFLLHISKQPVTSKKYDVWKIFIIHEISRYWPHLSTLHTTKYLFNTIKLCLGFRAELWSKFALSPLWNILHSKCIKIHRQEIDMVHLLCCHWMRENIWQSWFCAKAPRDESVCGRLHSGGSWMASDTSRPRSEEGNSNAIAGNQPTTLKYADSIFTKLT